MGAADGRWAHGHRSRAGTSRDRGVRQRGMRWKSGSVRIPNRRPNLRPRAAGLNAARIRLLQGGRRGCGGKPGAEKRPGAGPPGARHPPPRTADVRAEAGPGKSAAPPPWVRPQRMRGPRLRPAGALAPSRAAAAIGAACVDAAAGGAGGLRAGSYHDRRRRDGQHGAFAFLLRKTSILLFFVPAQCTGCRPVGPVRWPEDWPADRPRSVRWRV